MLRLLSISLVTALALAACASPTDAEPGSAEAAYTHTPTTTLHYCMTRSVADPSGVVSWVSLGVSRRGEGPWKIATSLHLELTGAEMEAGRNANPYQFSDYTGRSEPLSTQTPTGTHFESANGALVLDVDPNDPHEGVNHEQYRKSAHGRVTVDFAAATLMPARIRALGVRTYDVDLRDCM